MCSNNGKYNSGWMVTCIDNLAILEVIYRLRMSEIRDENTFQYFVMNGRSHQEFLFLPRAPLNSLENGDRFFLSLES